MSLDAIRNLRRGGQKPSVVFVVISDRPEPSMEGHAAVFVRPGDDPRFIDWRPLVGVLVAVFTVIPRPDLTLDVLDQLQAAGARFLGAADALGVYPLIVDSTERHEELLRRAWSLLCR